MYPDQLVPYVVQSLENGYDQTNSVNVDLSNKYKEFLKNKVSELKEVKNMTAFALDVADKSMDQYNRCRNISAKQKIDYYEKWTFVLNRPIVISTKEIFHACIQIGRKTCLGRKSQIVYFPTKYSVPILGLVTQSTILKEI